MSLRDRIAVVLLAASLGCDPPAVDPPPPWPGPHGPYVFAEAEDASTGKGWLLLPNEVGTLGEGSSGRGALAAVGAVGEATTTVRVPADGRWRLWLRYAEQGKDGGPSGQLRMRVVQRDVPALDHVFEATPGAKAPLAWASQDVPLEEGRATITWSGTGPFGGGRSAVRVDCLLLTTDPSYQPNERDFAPQTYLRVRLARSEPAEVYFHLFLDHLRAPFYDHASIGARGLASAVKVAPEAFVSPGGATPWVNVSRLLYGDSRTNVAVDAAAGYPSPLAATSSFDLDFATAPDDARIVATLHRKGPGSGLRLTVPPDPSNGQVPVADATYARQSRDFVKELAPVTFGRRPTRFPVLTDLPVQPGQVTPGTLEDERTALAWLGLDGLTRPVDADDVAAGFVFGRVRSQVWFLGPGGLLDPQLDRIGAGLAQSRAISRRAPPGARVVSDLLMDEASPRPLAEMAGRRADEQAFVDWLRERGDTPASLGVASWSRVHLQPDRDAGPPALYLRSQEFRAWSVADLFAKMTKEARAQDPKGPGTTQNFSDGAVVYANLYTQGNDYFTWFREHALDIAHGEDYTNRSSTDELCGWNVALLRAATREGQQPIHMYVVAGAGRTPLRVKLKASSDLAEGAKSLAFYAYAPLYASHEAGWYRSPAVWPAIAEVTHEIGAAEEELLDAMPRPAEAAILYSVPADIWSVGVDNVQGMERMHTWLALRHAQVPVDVLGDDDVRGGRLDGYRVAWLFGEQLEGREASRLVAWVRAGGTLVLSPGAGSRDELDRPSTALDGPLHLAREPEQVLQRFDGNGVDLAGALRSKGEVHLLGAGGRVVETVPLLARSQRFGATKGATVLATFADGSPAAISVPAGRGRVVMFGFLPALDYITAARRHYEAEEAGAPAHPSSAVARALAAADQPTTSTWARYGGFPTRFDPALRELVAAPARLAGVRPPLTVDVPQVEATLLDGSQGLVVALANWTGAPLDRITVTLDPGRGLGPLRSAHQGELVKAPPSGRLTVTLPLETTDLLYAPWGGGRRPEVAGAGP